MIDLANRIREQTKNFIGPDSSILLGMNMTSQGEKGDSMLSDIHSHFTDDRSIYYDEMGGFMGMDTGI